MKAAYNAVAPDTTKWTKCIDQMILFAKDECKMNEATQMMVGRWCRVNRKQGGIIREKKNPRFNIKPYYLLSPNSFANLLMCCGERVLFPFCITIR